MLLTLFTGAWTVNEHTQVKGVSHMSLAAVTAAFAVYLPPTEKIVLLALADHADPAGGNIRPAKERIARMASMSPRAVQYKLKRLVDLGLIEIAEPSTWSTPTVYRMAESVMAGGAKSAPPRGQGEKTRGAKKAEEGEHAVAPEPNTEPKPIEQLPKPPAPNGASSSCSPEWPSPQALVKLYNDQAPDNVPAVEVLSPRRLEKARRALRTWPEQSWWEAVFREYRRSRFLSGRVPPSNGHASFRPDFDWLLSTGRDGTENAVKVHDGAYTD